MPKIFQAGSVPRFIRVTQLGSLPLKAVIGFKFVRGERGANLMFDIVMLPKRDFSRMRSHMGVRHILAPTLTPGPEFSPAFIVGDAKEVVVPEGVPDPESYARDYFLKAYGLEDYGVKEGSFPEVRKEITHPLEKGKGFPFSAS